MTVSSIRPVNNHWGNGSTTVFDFDFLIENQSELVVTHVTDDGIRTKAIFGVDYSIHEIGNKNGSYIVFPLENSSFNVLKNGELLSLALSLEIKQESEFHNSANLELEVLEWTFDYVIRLIQMLRSELDRTLKVEEGSEATAQNMLVNLNEAQKNTYLYFQESKTNYEKSLEQANQAKLSANIATEQATIAINKVNDAVSIVDGTLNNTQITNCIKEVPEKIKYTLLNGVLTLKAGSQLVIPNGFETNGTTRKFNKVILNKDITFAYGGKAENLVVCATASGQFFSTIINYALSDSLEPTVGENRVIWFDATNNIVKTKTSGNDWISNLSFPLFIVDLDSSAKVTNLKNVFNGFGVIGHHTFSYEGIKSLIPNGKNPDGTLKNIETITTSINVRDELNKPSWICFWDGTNISLYGINNYFEQDVEPTFSGQYCMWLNTKENIMYSTSDSGATWTAQPRMYLGVLRKNSSSGDFQNVSFKTPVELVKMDDFEPLKTRYDSTKAYITETYVNGTSGYRIWSDKFCVQWGSTEAQESENYEVVLLKEFKDTNYNVMITCKSTKSTSNGWNYAHTLTTTTFKIIQTASGAFWQASGYIA